ALLPMLGERLRPARPQRAGTAAIGVALRRRLEPAIDAGDEPDEETVRLLQLALAGRRRRALGLAEDPVERRRGRRGRGVLDAARLDEGRQRGRVLALVEAAAGEARRAQPGVAARDRDRSLRHEEVGHVLRLGPFGVLIPAWDLRLILPAGER